MSIRTDLALEAAETTAKAAAGTLPKGVLVQEETLDGVSITTVTVTGEEGAAALGKAPGQYITVETGPFAAPRMTTEPEIAAMAKKLRSLLPPQGTILVVGLGNPHITPDDVGPRTADLILATRHLSEQAAETGGLPDFRPVAVLAPGVLAQTGVETGEVVASLCKSLAPAAVIVVDALAARSLSRLGATLQMADSGISPGSGVQNRRFALSRETLGVPVISMGVPTVVDATTLAHNLLRFPEGEEAELRGLFLPEGEGMMVTPRDVDLLVERAAKVLSLTINKALQPDLTLEEITYLVS